MAGTGPRSNNGKLLGKGTAEGPVTRTVRHCELYYGSVERYPR
jgi:hypothetical protein